MHAHTHIIKKHSVSSKEKHNKNGQNISSHILMGWGCQGDLACSHGRRWSLSAYIGGKEGRKGGRHTRWFHSGDPVSTACVKKRREGKEKTSTGPSKTRGEKGSTLSSPELASFFSLSLLWFFPLFSLPLCFTYILNLSHSLSFLYISLSLIILPLSVSLRHVFQGLSSIDTVSTNSSPPVPSESPSGRWRAGRGPLGKPAGYGVIRVSWRGGHKPSYLITTVALSGDAWKEKHTGPCPIQYKNRDRDKWARSCSV